MEVLNIDKTNIDSCDIEHILNISKDISLFGGLNEKQMDVIMDHSEVLRVKKGEYLFRRGDSPKEIYIIISGVVDFYLDDNNIKTAKSGFSFAESALIGIQKQVVDAIATTDLELLIISKEKLMNLFNVDKEIFGIFILNIARELSRRLAIVGDLLLEK